MKNVQQLLEAKGPHIHSTSPDASVYEALQQMAREGIGALVVFDDGKLVGIMSERDYARKVILADRSSRDTLVREIMTSDVLCVPPTALVEPCMSLMTDKHVRHLVVFEKGSTLGVISIGDVVKAVIEGQEFTIEQLQHYVQTGH
jgi:CBS domain-containing protein